MEELDGKDKKREENKLHVQPVMFAGIYDVWHGKKGENFYSRLYHFSIGILHVHALNFSATATDAKDGETEQSEPLYSYTIVTVPADKTLTWLHDRMPAILRTPEEAAAWLDSEHVPIEKVIARSFARSWNRRPLQASQFRTPLRPKAISLLRPFDGLNWHAVSPKVGNVREKGPELIERVKTEEDKKKKLAKGMAVCDVMWGLKSVSCLAVDACCLTRHRPP